MTELGPVEQHNEYEQDRVLAELAMTRIKQLITAAFVNPEETTTTMDWDTSQQQVEINDDADLAVQLERTDVHDEMYGLYKYSLNANDPRRSTSMTTEDELMMLLEGPTPQIKTGSVSKLSYLNNQMRHVQLTYVEIEIEELGLSRAAMVQTDDEEQSKHYSLIASPDDEILGMIHVSSNIEDADEQRTIEELIEPLPMIAGLNVLKIVSGSVDQDEMDMMLLSIEEAASETVDQATLSNIMVQVCQIYQRRLQSYVKERESGEIFMDLERLMGLHAILDEKAEDLDLLS